MKKILFITRFPLSVYIFFPRNWNIYITIHKIVLKENFKFNAKKSYLKKLKNNVKTIFMNYL